MNPDHWKTAFFIGKVSVPLGNSQSEMYYWNKDNFEGLEAIALSLQESTDVKEFSDYCRLRAEGLRKQAFEALTRFLFQALNWEFEKRRDFVNWLLTAQYNNPKVHQLIPHPLMKKLLEPTLNEWVQYQPESPIPHRWRGVYFRELEELERALALDATDLVARSFAASRLLKDVEYDTHHLSDGIFLGSEEEAESLLEEAFAHIQGLPESENRSSLETSYERLRHLLDDWLEYKEAPQGTFPEWCKSRGRQHFWWKVVYYKK